MLARPNEATRPRRRGSRPGAGSRGREFASARSHSRRVRCVQVGGAGGRAADGSRLLRSIPSVSPRRLDRCPGMHAVADGKLVMTKPKLDGFTKDNLPYSMRALRAMQDVEPRGHHRAAGHQGQAARRRDKCRDRGCAQGRLQPRREHDEIPATSPSQPPTAWRQASKRPSSTSARATCRPDPVEIRSAASRIAADSMSVLENGKVLVFEKRVESRSVPASSRPAKARGRGKCGEELTGGARHRAVGLAGGADLGPACRRRPARAGCRA